jgi:NADH:ubiquinone oxidoreductase subunit F (NADH-binding)
MSAMTLDATDRLLAGSTGAGPSPDLATHLATYGPLALPERLDDGAWRQHVVEAITESGLLGRGGGGFPAGLKWDAARRTGRGSIVAINVLEGEPASAKDRILATYAPHLVLDGAEVAALAVGASEIVIAVTDHSRPVAAAFQSALAERRAAGRARIPVTLVRPPGRYITGEESALVSWLDHRVARPFLRVDKAVPLRAGRRPVLVHNAETLSQVALIARFGPEWFRRLGTPDAPGSTLVTVSGAVRLPGVVEVELGTPVIDILGRSGLDGPLAGVLIGGYGGAWMHPAQLTTPFAPGPLTAAGATLGAGILVALPAGACGIAETARVARYMAGQSAGQCGPCVFGLPAIADDLERLWAGTADPGSVERILHRAATVEGRGACRHPDGVVRLVRTALTVFADDVRSHAEGRPCAGHRAATVMAFPADAFPGRAPRATGEPS